MRVERRYFVNAGIAVVVSVAIYLFGRVGLVWLDRDPELVACDGSRTFSFPNDLDG